MIGQYTIPKKLPVGLQRDAKIRAAQEGVDLGDLWIKAMQQYLAEDR